MHTSTSIYRALVRGLKLKAPASADQIPALIQEGKPAWLWLAPSGHLSYMRYPLLAKQAHSNLCIMGLDHERVTRRNVYVIEHRSTLFVECEGLIAESEKALPIEGLYWLGDQDRRLEMEVVIHSCLEITSDGTRALEVEKPRTTF